MDRKITVSNPTHETATIERDTFSKTVRRMFGLSLHTWENVMVASLAVAAVAAAILGIATFAVVQLQRQEISTSKDEFERYKLDAGQKLAETNLKIERLKAPRTLSAEEQARMTEKLKVFQGTRFGVVTYPWEEEPSTFKSILLGVLDRAGWKPDISHGLDSLPKLSPGIVVSLGTVTPPNIHDPAKALVDALRNEGFAARIEYGNVDHKRTAIEIQIGTKH